MEGMGACGLAGQLGGDRGEASDYMARDFARYPGVHAFMEASRERAHRDGYVETLFGRRLYLENLTSRNQGLRQGAERAAVNAPMQGTAEDIIKRAMIAVARSEEHTSELQSLMRISYAVFCLKKKKKHTTLSETPHKTRNTNRQH